MTATQRCILPHPGEKRPEAATGLVCDDHAAALNETLRDILDLFGVVILDSYIPLPSVAPGGEKHTKQADPPAPGRLDAMDLTDPRQADRTLRDHDDLHVGEMGDVLKVPHRLRWWAETVRKERGLTGATLLDGTVAHSVQFLQAHREWVYAQRTVRRYETELRGMRRVLAAMLGEGDPQPIARCPTMVEKTCGGNVRWPQKTPGDVDGVCDRCGQTCRGWSNGGWMPTSECARLVQRECGGPLWPDPGGAMEVTCGRCERVFDEPMLRHLGGMIEATG